MRDLVTPSGGNVHFVVCVSSIVHFKPKMLPFKCLDTCSYVQFVLFMHSSLLV